MLNATLRLDAIGTGQRGSIVANYFSVLDGTRPTGISLWARRHPDGWHWVAVAPGVSSLDGRALCVTRSSDVAGRAGIVVRCSLALVCEGGEREIEAPAEDRAAHDIIATRRG